jgi:hypothetical protein
LQVRLLNHRRWFEGSISIRPLLWGAAGRLFPVRTNHQLLRVPVLAFASRPLCIYTRRCGLTVRLDKIFEHAEACTVPAAQVIEQQNQMQCVFFFDFRLLDAVL